jgi:A/G-specific adenine glycosylase
MQHFNQIIHAWYRHNKRDLPWRQTTDPYKIWLSEIILQQTRIEQGTSYFVRFAETFPTIKHLANASEEEVLKLWQGLGYYTRARNLHATAKKISTEMNGLFPNTYEDIKKLRGIGDYTAAAIASIAFGLPHAAVDGNVYRVLSRYFGIQAPIDSASGKKEFKQLAQELISEMPPHIHNQAMMEFGALQCVPAPDCPACPLNGSCYALTKNMVAQLPVKQNKPKVRNRYFNYLVLLTNESTYLSRRTQKDIWLGLYEFPLIETSSRSDVCHIVESDEFRNFVNPEHVILGDISNWKTHPLSHQRIHYRFIKFAVGKESGISETLIRTNKKDIFNFAVPRLIETFINDNIWE